MEKTQENKAERKRVRENNSEHMRKTKGNMERKREWSREKEEEVEIVRGGYKTVRPKNRQRQRERDNAEEKRLFENGRGSKDR